MESLLLHAIPVFLGVMLLAPLTLLVTKPWHHLQDADERMLALGLGSLLASITLLFLIRLIRSLDDGDSLGVETHWGGLGGGVGGWKISRSLGLLLCVMAFGGLTAVAASRYPQETTTTQTTTAPPKADTKPVTANTTTTTTAPPKTDAKPETSTTATTSSTTTTQATPAPATDTKHP